MVSMFGLHDACLREAQNLINKNHYQEAEKILSEQQKRSSDIFTQLHLARAIQYQNRIQEAVGIYENILNQNVREPCVIHYHIALLHFDLNRYDNCLKEIQKIKNINPFHLKLKACAAAFKELSLKKKDMTSIYQTLFACRTTSIDIQARILFKLENYLPINLAKRSFRPMYLQPTNYLFLSKYRTQEKINRQNQFLEKAKQLLEQKDYLEALSNMQKAFSFGIQPELCESLQKYFSGAIIEILASNAEIKLSPLEITYAFFYTQQFQKGIDYTTPYLFVAITSDTYKNYIELLEITGAMHFSLGLFQKASNFFQKKISEEKKQAELSNYLLAASLQHLHQPYPAIHSYKNLVQSYRAAYLTYLNIAFATLDPQIPLKIDHF